MERAGWTKPGSLTRCLSSLRHTASRRMRSSSSSLAPLRDGASDEELEQIVRDAVWRKELKHHVNDPGFVPPERTMSQIGG